MRVRWIVAGLALTMLGPAAVAGCSSSGSSGSSARPSTGTSRTDSGGASGAASVAEFGGDRAGQYAYLTLRVVREHRRRGVGTALHVRASKHARELGKPRFYAVVRHDDPDSLGYYAACGFEEIGRMQDVRLDLES
ncbi:MAG: N-acetyltransferase family protein, partial [Frankia sp.]